MRSKKSVVDAYWNSWNRWESDWVHYARNIYADLSSRKRSLPKTTLIALAELKCDLMVALAVQDILLWVMDSNHELDIRKLTSVRSWKEIKLDASIYEQEVRTEQKDDEGKSEPIQ